VRAQAAALDSVMLMYVDLHELGPVDLPPPAARAELALHTTLPAPSVGPDGVGPDSATRGARRPVLGSTAARHVTAFRRPALEATSSAQGRVALTLSAAAMPALLAAAAPRACASPLGASLGGSLSRPRVVEEALLARKYYSGSGAAMPSIAVQRTRLPKTHRSTDDLPARSKIAMGDHPLWTMPLHTSDSDSQATSVLGAGESAWDFEAEMAADLAAAEMAAADPAAGERPMSSAGFPARLRSLAAPPMAMQFAVPSGRSDCPPGLQVSSQPTTRERTSTWGPWRTDTPPDRAVRR